MTDHQNEEHAVEDLDVPEADAEHVHGGLGVGKKLSPVGLKITLDGSRYDA
jgi:hypothetical protein